MSIKYPIRKEAIRAIAGEISSAISDSLTKRTLSTDIYRTCGTCIHKDTSQNKFQVFCQSYQQPVPINWVLRGCDGYEDIDEIPL